MQSNAGYSLIELLIVLSLLAYVGLWSVQPFHQINQQIQIRSVAALMAQSLERIVFQSYIQKKSFHFDVTGDYSTKWKSTLTSWQLNAQFIENNQTKETQNSVLKDGLSVLIASNQAVPNLNLQLTSSVFTTHYNGQLDRFLGVAFSFYLFFHPKKALKISVHNISNRIRVCGFDLVLKKPKKHFGYLAC